MIPPLITLTLTEVKAAARKAYDEGRLGFQNGHHTCRYRYGDTNQCCAIGAALPDDVACAFDRVPTSDVFALKNKGLLAVAGPFSDYEKIRAIQSAHDGICSPYAEAYQYDREYEIQKFLALIDHPKAKDACAS